MANLVGKPGTILYRPMWADVDFEEATVTLVQFKDCGRPARDSHEFPVQVGAIGMALGDERRIGIRVFQPAKPNGAHPQRENPLAHCAQSCPSKPFSEEAALKLLFLALRQATKKWTMPIHHWREALNHFTILWPERMPALERVAQ
jgi:hypothetical protein